MKCFLVFLGLAAASTLALSPAVGRWLFYRDQPPTPPDWRPKYVIGGRIVTREQFNERIPA
jgi:hypothetical protein